MEMTLNAHFSSPLAAAIAAVATATTVSSSSAPETGFCTGAGAVSRSAGFAARLVLEDQIEYEQHGPDDGQNQKNDYDADKAIFKP